MSLLFGTLISNRPASDSIVYKHAETGAAVYVNIVNHDMEAAKKQFVHDNTKCNGFVPLGQYLGRAAFYDRQQALAQAKTKTTNASSNVGRSSGSSWKKRTGGRRY